MKYRCGNSPEAVALAIEWNKLLQEKSLMVHVGVVSVSLVSNKFTDGRYCLTRLEGTFKIYLGKCLIKKKKKKKKKKVAGQVLVCTFSSFYSDTGIYFQTTNWKKMTEMEQFCN